MKKRILGVLTVLLALSMVFAMVSCKSSTSSTPDNKIIITFDLNYTGAPDPWTVELGEGETTLGTLLPTKVTESRLDRAGWYFTGWRTWTDESSGFTVDADYEFPGSMTVYAQWAEEKITLTAAEEASAEVLYLTNGAAAIYQFTIPEGKTLGDYDKISVEYIISDAALAAWKQYGGRHVRLYGVYTSATPTTTQTDQKTSLGPRTITYYNLSGIDEKTTGENRLNNGYILDNSKSNGNAVRDGLSGNTWFTLEYDITGAQKHADYNTANLQTTATGTVYFGLGIGCQLVGYGDGGRRDATFIQVVKNIQLLPVKPAETKVVDAAKPVASAGQFLQPGYVPGEFLANNDPIVFEWRAPATADNVANWRDYVPDVPASTADRGAEPATLVEVELFNATTYANTTPAVDGFTYINSGNPNNQRGWVSFTEAGRADNQAYKGAASKVAFENFRDAWYLVLETEKTFTGGAQLIWQGDAGGWNSNAITDGGTGALLAATGATQTGSEADGYVIKFPLATALGQYGRYYNDNAEWAALILQYWGQESASVATLGIKKAYLLVETAVPSPTGVSVNLTFALGTAPAGGDLIKDIVLDKNGELLEITTAAGLSDFVWYVDGTKDAETTGTLVLGTAGTEMASGTKVITVEAKRSGLFVSQTVFVTVDNN